MNRSRQTGRYALIFIAILFAALILIDRYYWAFLAQWREDQATNLWLGYTAGFSHVPVGLISSTNIPNPNGMVLLGAFLSLLPSLHSISFLLGTVQVFLLLLVGWKTADGNRSWQYFLLAALPAVCSIILRSASVEFWNQYTITLINIFFIFWALRYLEKPSVWNLPPIAVLVLLAPSLYLAGVVNAIVMVIITLGLLIYRPPDTGGILYVIIIILSILVASVLLTWLPYFQNVSLEQLADYNKNSPGPVATFRVFWESFFGIPIYGTFEWADQSIFARAIKHADEGILTYPTKILLRLVARAYLLQAVFAFLTVLYIVYRAYVYGLHKTFTRSSIHHPALRLFALSVLFISLSFTVSTWAGGPDWLKGERPDQVVQFLPMFLYFIFMLPVIIRIEGNAGRLITGFSYFSLAFFVTVSLLCGFIIIRDHLQYRGNVLSEADVPLLDKQQAVDFIAKDWIAHSDSRTISIDYDIDRGVWDKVSATEPAMRLVQWYPASLTEGRVFDYDLLRRYGLKNVQEGIQLRIFGNGRYLLTYAFEDPPLAKTDQITHHIFGRLRVTVVEK